MNDMIFLSACYLLETGCTAAPKLQASIDIETYRCRPFIMTNSSQSSGSRLVEWLVPTNDGSLELNLTLLATPRSPHPCFRMHAMRSPAHGLKPPFSRASAKPANFKGDAEMHSVIVNLRHQRHVMSLTPSKYLPTLTKTSQTTDVIQHQYT